MAALKNKLAAVSIEQESCYFSEMNEKEFGLINDDGGKFVTQPEWNERTFIRVLNCKYFRCEDENTEDYCKRPCAESRIQAFS
ncbi:MAG: hypothetical protein QXT05_00540 [Candidatus Bilamarchaeaceae archaeon]